MIKRAFCLWSLIIFIGITFPSFLKSQSKSLMAQDGSDWITGRKDEFERFHLLGLIGGIIMGTDVAQQETEGGIEVAIVSLKAANANEHMIDLVKHTKDRLGMVQIVGITIGQIADGVDIYYNDFANRRIKIIDAIYVVKMQIEGQDPDLIQAQTRFLRMPPISQDDFNRIAAKMVDETKIVSDEEFLKMGTYQGQRLFRYGKY
jgi:hypothetical protein